MQLKSFKERQETFFYLEDLGIGVLFSPSFYLMETLEPYYQYHTVSCSGIFLVLCRLRGFL